MNMQSSGIEIEMSEVDWIIDRFNPVIVYIISVCSTP